MANEQTLKEKIGFIGLGIMGKPMALNLLRAGYPVQVFARSRQVAEEAEAAGATIADSPARLAAGNDLIITMLPDSPQVHEVALGSNGLVHGLSSGKLYIDMSTIDAATELQIHERFATIGTDTLDAPVSGGENGAIEATLSIMVGGSQTAFERAFPVLQALGKRITHMGPAGSGLITKLCNQVATALATQGVIEAFTLAKKAGVDLARLREAMLGGFAESKALQVAGAKIIRREFAPGFKMKLYQKDLRIVLAEAKAHSLNLPGTQLLFEEMSTCVKDGSGELDFSALVQLFE